MNWNAFFFVISKALFLALSILLYRGLTIHDFSVWANINSVIFLFLLLIDCGFRKSIPRYAPEFAKNENSMRQFIRSVIIFQSSILLTIAPLFFFLVPRLANSFGIGKQVDILYLGCVLFVVEGVVSVIRLIFHSYFWQKQFNLAMTAVLTIFVFLAFALIFFVNSSHSLIRALFCIKIGAGVVTIAIGLIMLIWLYKDKSYHKKEQPVEMKKISIRFVKHSGVMWANSTIKSLTERNFLVPFFTYTLGPQVGNLFKISNDTALFFQRIVLKTIGTTDTSLLAHIESKPNTRVLMPQVFERLIKKVSSLCIPLVAIILVFTRKVFGILDSGHILKPFFVLSICYLTHTILSPYERFLEVKRCYFKLLIAYTPYLIMIPLFLFPHIISSVGLFGSIILVHTVRLVSAFGLLFIGRKQFRLRFPVRYTTLLLSVSLASCAAIYALLCLIPPFC